MTTAWTPMTLIRTGLCFAGIMANRYRSRESMKALQLRKLQGLVRHCYQTVPFYRALMEEARVTPADIRSLKDLSLIPINGRVERQAAAHSDLLSTAISADDMTEWNSSGTTGRPIVVGIDQSFDRVRRAVFLRMLIQSGHRLRDPSVIVLGPGAAWRAPRWTRLTYLTGGVDHRSFLEELDALAPRMMYASTVWLREVLDLAPASARLSHPIQRIYTTSETLPDSLRHRIETVFGGSVTDLYGSAEIGLAGWECPMGGYHVADDAVLLERVTEGAGPGRVIATNLDSFGMPFLRYDTGDLMAEPPEQPCQCPGPFTRIGRLEGRNIDAIRKPDGGILFPSFVTRAIQQVPGIAQYQVVQDSIDRFRLRVQTKADVGPDLENHLRETLGSALWPSAQIEVERAEHLSQPGKKFRVIVSHCGALGQDPAQPVATK